MRILLALLGCTIENEIHSLEVITNVENQTGLVQQASACIVEWDQAALIPTHDATGNVSDTQLSRQQQQISTIQNAQSATVENLAAENGFTTEDLFATGEVPAHILVFVNQNQPYDDASYNEYYYYLVFGATTESLQTYLGNSLAELTNQQQLDGIFARTVVQGEGDLITNQCGTLVDGEITNPIEITYSAFGDATLNYENLTVEIPSDDLRFITQTMTGQSRDLAGLAVQSVESTLNEGDFELVAIVPLNQP